MNIRTCDVPVTLLSKNFPPSQSSFPGLKVSSISYYFQILNANIGLAISNIKQFFSIIKLYTVSSVKKLDIAP